MNGSPSAVTTGRILCFLVTLGLNASPRAELVAAEPLRVRVLSYNIHHGEGTDGKLDLERIARVIDSVTADVVALQEVDKNVTRTGGVDQPAELGRLTKLNVAFGGNIRFQGGDYGNATLSRLAILREKNHLLPSIDQGEQRGVLEVELKLAADAPPLRFFNTHFDARRPGEERVASARAINELVAKDPKRAALLAGDLNDVAESETLKLLGSQWSKTGDAALPTIPSNKPRRQIDFVLFRPTPAWRVVECRVLDEAVASDHRAIFAVLELQPRTP
jgi:endonuclease/exonuclease/phosphatase family metal-dependent hydrolase